MTSHEAGALELALKEFQAELTLNPYDAVAEYQVAQIFQAQGKAAQASAGFERAIALDPKFAEPLVALGKLRMEQKNDAEAISLLLHAVSIAPGNESARYSLMMAYRNAGTDGRRPPRKGRVGQTAKNARRRVHGLSKETRR